MFVVAEFGIQSWMNVEWLAGMTKYMKIFRHKPHVVKVSEREQAFIKKWLTENIKE